MKPGTRIEILGFTLSGKEVWYPAKIGRQLKKHGEPPAGYHPVTYDDGAKLLCHETSFRVVQRTRQTGGK